MFTSIASVTQVSWKTLVVNALELKRPFLQQLMLLVLCSCHSLQSRYRDYLILSPGFTLSSSLCAYSFIAGSTTHLLKCYLAFVIISISLLHFTVLYLTLYLHTIIILVLLYYVVICEILCIFFTFTLVQLCKKFSSLHIIKETIITLKIQQCNC